MSHLAYSPVGYDFRADHYCLDCIPKVASIPNVYGLDDHGVKRVITRNGGTGYHKNACNCCECRLDRMAAARGIDRMDEGSYDSGDFPKSIPYHNDLHYECGPESYGYGPDDDEWQSQYCGAVCAACHAVIDGVSKIDGPDVCPTYDARMANA
jgi:hypothetical protein